ncbi:MAG: amidohydrolase family protein [Luteitalea sp.]|nr:amidohydrolase family protein [Luteitalea sp.]
MNYRYIALTGVIGAALWIAGALAERGAFRDETATETSAASAVAPNVTAFVGVRVFDGARAIPGANVIVADGRIAAMGPDAEVPKGARRVDGAGRTLLPGLIDAHTHVFGDALERALQFGVTTELDMFTDHRFATAMRREQEAGDVPTRADLRSAGTLVTAPGGHGTEYGVSIPTITSPEQAQAFVDARLAEGSDYIKIVYDDGSVYGLQWPTIDRETLAAVVEAAHARDRLALVHMGSQRAARDAIEAGADGLVHVFADSAPEPELVELIAKRRAFVIPTLSVNQSVTGVASGATLPEDAHVAPYLTATEIENLKRAFPTHRGSKARAAHAFDAVRRLNAAGVAILAGTDAPNPGTAHGASVHRELELLVEAGLTPIQALAAATAVPARIFALADRGRIAPGLRADLLLVDSDPTSNIAATRAIVGIWKGGVEVTRQKPSRATTDGGRRRVDARGRVSDFDDGTTRARFGLGWSASTDQMMGGTSTAEMKVVRGGARGTAHALEVIGTVRDGAQFPWAGAIFFPGGRPMEGVNLSAFTELRFWARGDGGTYLVMVFAERFGMVPVEVPFEAGVDWREHVIPFSTFQGLDGRGVRGILFSARPGPDRFAFQIDDVQFR